VRRRILAPFLICTLLALPGCRLVKSSVKRGITRFVSGAIAGMLFGADEASADDEEFIEEDDTSVAEDDGGWDDEEEATADASGGSGFYKVVEANGTVRFVSNLSEVPSSQRPNAERLAMERSNDPAKPKRRAAPKPATKQLAAAKTSAPSAAAMSGSHDVVVYTTSWCGWCKKTLAYLDENRVDYQNRDVETNAEWAEEMQDLTGSGGVPVIVIDGEVIKGFNQAKIEQLLKG
jgi:glutaredoxin-like YruB-family protein